MAVATFDVGRTSLLVSVEGLNGQTKYQVLDGADSDAGRWSSMAVDGGDRVHLVWSNASAQRLRYGRRDTDGVWQIEDISDAEINGSHTALVVDDDGRVHVAYRDEDASALAYARRDLDGHWHGEILSRCGGGDGGGDGDDQVCEQDFGQSASMIVVGGQPRIAFYDARWGNLGLATATAEGWEFSVLDGDARLDVGRFVSMALDPRQNPAVAYYDATHGALKYLQAGERPLVVDQGQWLHEETGAVRDHLVGQHVVLRFDSLGRAVMLYLDAGALRVKQAVVSADRVVAVKTVESLAPGAFFDFQFLVDDQLRGAYGAWSERSPRTTLTRFLMPVYVE